MTEIQQSPLYAHYMTRLKWTVLTVDGVQVFIRRFPLFGSMIKIHRPEKLPRLTILQPILVKFRISTLVIEPIASQDQKILSQWCQKVSKIVKLYKGTAFLPTKTIRVNLAFSEKEIFHRFSEAKRRAVRRAVKLGVTIQKSSDIKGLITIKNKSSGLFGFITTTGIDKLWDTFAPKNATILLAYNRDKIIGGVLLLFWDNVAYYWIAGSTTYGKKLFAPTMLAWEALRVSKKRRCKNFDFVGVWDERTPTFNRDWFGFTKFKEGFGGVPVYYPLTSQNM